jgi:hypothetical protein
MSFLPDNYEKEKKISNYMKFGEGKNRFRIMSPAIIGYVWFEKTKRDDGSESSKPVRVKTAKQVPIEKFKAKDSRLRAKYFWAFVIWNYETEQLQILELKQSGLITSLEELVMSEAWGDPQKYDLTVVKRKTGSQPMDVEYSLIPDPPKKMEGGIVQFYNDSNIKLEALFEGKDPFDDSEEESDVSDVPADLE